MLTNTIEEIILRDIREKELISEEELQNSLKELQRRIKNSLL